MCVRDRMATPFATAIHITLVDCNQLHHVDIYIYIPSHRTCPSSATRRRWPRARRLAKTRMLVGSTASYRPASPTTRLSPTNASEDYVTIALPPSVYRLCNHYTSTSPFTHIIIGSLHNVCTAITCICALILPQDSRLDRSAAPSRATCTQLRVLSGCRARGVTLVAWQRHMCTHRISVR